MKPCSAFAAALGLCLLNLPATGSAQGENPASTTETSSVTTPGGAFATPGVQAPASSTAAKLPVNDVTKLRRLVRDVASNTNNIRASGNFGAQLWLTANAGFAQDWRKPDAPSIAPVEIALRGQTIYTVLIFYGESRTAAGLGNVSYDMTVTRPDGSVYDRRDALVGFQNLAPDEREMQLGRNNLSINIGPDDPAGIYTVTAVVHDNVAKSDLMLKETFVVQ